MNKKRKKKKGTGERQEKKTLARKRTEGSEKYGNK